MKSNHVECTTCSLVCAHCRATDALASVPADHLVDAVRGFLLRHRRCEKPLEPSKQVELFQALSSANPESHPCNPGIDGSTEEPAPEIDPPSPYEKFERMYPLATNHVDLWESLRSAIPKSQCAKLPSELPWDADTGIFNAVATWSRIERAHLDAAQRAPIPGLTIPARLPMPEKLVELLGVKPKRMKGARPLTSPGRKKKP